MAGTLTITDGFEHLTIILFHFAWLGFIGHQNWPPLPLSFVISVWGVLRPTAGLHHHGFCPVLQRLPAGLSPSQGGPAGHLPLSPLLLPPHSLPRGTNGSSRRLEGGVSMATVSRANWPTYTWLHRAGRALVPTCSRHGEWMNCFFFKIILLPRLSIYYNKYGTPCNRHNDVCQVKYIS